MSPHSYNRRNHIISSIIILLLPVIASSASPGPAQDAPPVITVSAASFLRRVAPGSIAAAFGSNLATATAAAAAQPLPTSLAGTTLRINGELARLFFVSPGQVNFLLPPGTPPGSASIEITAGDGTVSRGVIEVVQVAAGLFTANSDGRGALASLLLRVENGNLDYQPLAQPGDDGFITRPIAFSNANESLFLVLYLTGLRLADPASVRVALGGEDYNPSFVGPAPGFEGLDQINLPLPLTFPARGRLSVVVKVNGFGASNDGEFEIGRGAEDERLEIIEAPAGAALAGEIVEIAGNGFAANPRENNVLMVADDGQTVRAEVIAATSNRLRVRVPPGAGSGELRIQRGTAEASAPLQIRTSISGVIEQARALPGGAVERTGIEGMQVRMLGRPDVSTSTGAGGAFVLEMPGEASASRVVIEIQGGGGALDFPRQLLSVNARARRDNQLPRAVELAAINPAFSNRLSPSIPDSQGLQIQFLLAGRTPANLPDGHFSSRIAQATPFGAIAAQGIKLTFPNDDAIPAGTTATLFQFDQRPESETLGRFIALGEARASQDGAVVETSDGAITEGSYYFVSIERPTSAVIGRVVSGDGRPLPRAIVSARGRSAFTDSYGGFVLTRVPVLRTNERDEIRLEVSYQRGDGVVLRNDETRVELRAGDASGLDSAIVLAEPPADFPPSVLAPRRVEIEAGKSQTFDVAVVEPNGETDPAFEISGSAQAFTTVAQGVTEIGGGVYRLRMEPTAAGEFELIVLARDSGGQTGEARIEVGVKQPQDTRPSAEWLSVATSEDAPAGITLSGSDPQGRPLTFRITSNPAQGSLGNGNGADRLYTPARRFNGVDRFRYVASNGTEESDEAEVTILVRPVNDPPQLEFEATREINAGERLEAPVTVVDPDLDDNIQITAEGLPSGATLEGAGPTRLLRWQPTITQQGVHIITLRARDGLGASVERTLTINVSAKWAKTSGLEGGFVMALLSEGGAVYAATFGGGVYRSIDDGQSWSPVNTGLTSFALYALALHPDANAIFLGTLNDGVYRSDDGGASWIKRSNGLAGQAEDVYALTTHANSIYAGTDDGVYATNDGGAVWTPVNEGLDEAGLNVRALWSHNGTLYLGSELGGVRRLNEAAGRWDTVNAGLEGEAQHINDLRGYNGALYAATGAGVFRFSAAQQRWDAFNAGVVPAGASSEALATAGGSLYQATGTLRAYRLDDATGQWTQVSAGLPEIPSDLPLTMASHESRLLIGTTNGIYRSNAERTSWAYASAGLEAAQVTSLLYDGDQLYSTTLGAGVYRSVDDGRTWNQIIDGLTGGARNVNRIHLHAGEIYIGTFGDGVYRFNRASETWTRISDGLEGNQLVVRTLGSHAGGLYAGTFGEGVFRFDAAAARWNPVNGGLPPEAFDVATFAEHDGRLYAGTLGGGVYRFNDAAERWEETNTGFGSVFAFFVRGLRSHAGALYAGTFGGGIYRTLNGGESWELYTAGLPLLGAIVESIESDGEVLYITTAAGVFRRGGDAGVWEAAGSDLIGELLFALAARDGRLAVGTGGNGVSLLADAAQSWSERNTGLTTNFINTLAANGGDLYAGTLGGGLFRSADGGATWTATNQGLPPNANHQSITTSGAMLLAGTFGDGIYRSSDGGMNWTPANTGLGNAFVNRLFTSGSAVYAGTDGGVFRSTDAGGNWTPVNTGIAGRPVLSFAIAGGTVVAGTREGGVYRLSADGATWTQSGLGALSVSALRAHGDALYAGTLGAGIYRSTDFGATWTPVNSGLPESLNVYAFAAIGGELFAGSVYGVFATSDSGAQWRQINAGLRDPIVTSFAALGNRLFAGTSSRGVFVSRTR
ncbi:MAG: hypothetical protein KF868_10000 [Acidobacteria bacterium]|nr:hypothetical protein [Acidobacteriota bacterium]